MSSIVYKVNIDRMPDNSIQMTVSNDMDSLVGNHLCPGDISQFVEDSGKVIRYHFDKYVLDRIKKV